MNAPDYSVLDEALDLLKPYGPEYRGGFTNHAPMAVEALCAMGRADAAIPWLDRYRQHLLPMLLPGDRIVEKEWRAPLGNHSRIADWIAFFENRFEEQDWREALKLWVPRLAPGIIAAATHGAIRTGHAVRGLAQMDTPQRRRELAQGLGYWAATYETLPAKEASNPGPLHPSEAISRVAIYPVERRGQFGSITEALTQLQDFEPFAGAADIVETAGDPSQFISDLTATFARVYLANANSILNTIVFVHSMTGPSALRPMLPYLPPEAVSGVLRYAWQAAAALFSIYAIRLPEGGTAAVESSEDLVDRAVAAGDEHAIKFAEVCLREYALNRRPEYLTASHHASEVLGGR